MKKVLILAVAITLIAAGTAFAVISGSKHDFSGTGWAIGPSGGAEICVPCHTPHNADLSVTDAPLWNHEVTTATFDLYSSSTLNATMAQPTGISKLCLSCHDGTVALENFGGNTGGSNFITGNALLGTNLKNDHPVGFTYDAALAAADGELVDPSANATVNGLLFSGQLECASCHDVHNSTGNAYLLQINNVGSALCLTCHVK